MRTVDLSNPIDAVWVRRYLCDGGVVACAAEGVWGLCCDPFNLLGVTALNALKGREQGKGYIVVSGQRRHFDNSESQLSASQKAQLDTLWPAAVSVIFPDPNAYFPPWIATRDSKGKQTIALRHTDHPQLVELSNVLASPLVSTSANPAGKEPATSAQQVIDYFGDDLVIVHSTPTQPGVVSRIIDITTGKKIR